MAGVGPLRAGLVRPGAVGDDARAEFARGAAHGLGIEPVALARSHREEDVRQRFTTRNWTSASASIARLGGDVQQVAAAILVAQASLVGGDVDERDAGRFRQNPRSATSVRPEDRP
jgi:hypothetical protein